MRIKTPKGTPKNLSRAPSSDDIFGEACPLGAACVVLQDMLALKYGEQLDDADFMSKAEVRCDRGARLSPSGLAQALNSEPALRLKDVANERLLQVELKVQEVHSFRELQSYIRSRPGTACAVTSVACSSSGAGRPQMVAAYREAYRDSKTLVAKARVRATSRVGVLHSFQEDTFHGAVILDPVIVRVLKYEAEQSRMLELQTPSISAEYGRTCDGRTTSDSEFAARTCSVLAGLGGSDDVTEASGGPEKIAAGACGLASACRVLGSFLPEFSKAFGCAEAASAVEAITTAMRRHTGVLEVQEAACSALAAGVVGGLKELQSAAASHGAIEQVSGAMRQFASAPGLQMWACGALASLTASHPVNQTAVLGIRAQDLVIAAMDRHGTSAALQTMACGALGTLAAGHSNNQTAIAAGGGLERVLAAMRRHPETPAVLQAAVGALWCAAQKHQENQALVARMGGPELVVEAVRRYPGDHALRHVATGVLQVVVPGLGDALARGGTPGPNHGPSQGPGTPGAGGGGQTPLLRAGGYTQ
eukprot:TRINITY_DN27143_c0_g1_i2.p1 TRINITY_DN27143_c0_g1~~TRINITY_DN27143_c0_g1_i2.p1  ORF type:complete len:534 (-),score=90.11 TRINITY_DN27143_c0_g1_i2:94-1695(-)